MKKPTRGPQATIGIFGEIIEHLEELDEDSDDQWEEIDKLKKGTKRNFMFLENGRLQIYRWRSEYIGPVPDV